jgi:hypothetical protein
MWGGQSSTRAVVSRSKYDIYAEIRTLFSKNVYCNVTNMKFIKEITHVKRHFHLQSVYERLDINMHFYNDSQHLSQK